MARCPPVTLLFLSCLWTAARADDGEPGDVAPDDVVPGDTVVDGEVVDGAETLVVEASGNPDPHHSAATVAVVPLGPELPPGEDLASAVDAVAGTQVRRLGGLGDYAGVSIRGSTMRQVEVYLDGIPLNPNGSHAVDLSVLPVTAFSRLELYRGFAPPSFGSAAIGGVLDLVTPSGPVAPSIGAAAGSWRTEHVWGVVGPRVGAVETLFTVDQLHTEGDWRYFDDQGTEYNLLDDRTPVRVHNARDRFTALGRVAFGPDAARFRVLDVWSRSDQQLAGPIANPSTLATWAADHNLLSLDADLAPGPHWRLSPRVWWLWRGETLDDRAGEMDIGPDWHTDTYHTFGGQLALAWAPAPWISTDVLARAREDLYHPVDHLEAREDGTRRRGVGAVAVSADLRTRDGSAVLTPVIQAEVLDNRFLGEVPFSSAPVAPESATLSGYVLPRGAARWEPFPWLTMRGSGGAYLRPPDFTELFGDEGMIVGNTDLVPEQGVTAEVGAHVQLTRERQVGLALDVGAARTRIHNLITFEPNSQQTQHAVNVGEAYVRSLEGGLVVCVGTVLDSTTSVTSTLSRNLDPDPVYANNFLPGVAPWEVSQTTRLTVAGRFSVSHAWSYTGATYADAANVQLQALRNLRSVAASVQPGPRFVALRAEVLNLFDVRGQAMDRNPYSTEDDTLVVKPLTDFGGYPLPGRTVMVAVTWQDTPKD